MGKSALAQTIAIHAAKQGKAVGAFSLEMSEEELGLRAIMLETGIDGHRLQRGRLLDREWSQLSAALQRLSDLPIYVDASPYPSISDIRSRARRLKLQDGLALLLIDYAQLMTGDETDESRALQIAAITRALKVLAKDLAIPVVLLSQLNRSLEGRPNKRPHLGDLRDSGAIEQDADIVIFIYRDDYYNKESREPGVAELIIAKQRNGPVGTVKVGWQQETTSFFNLAADAPSDRQLPLGDRA
jgi:replicative DNA helicase